MERTRRAAGTPAVWLLSHPALDQRFLWAEVGDHWWIRSHRHPASAQRSPLADLYLRCHPGDVSCRQSPWGDWWSVRLLDTEHTGASVRTQRAVARAISFGSYSKARTYGLSMALSSTLMSRGSHIESRGLVSLSALLPSTDWQIERPLG